MIPLRLRPLAVGRLNMGLRFLSQRTAISSGRISPLFTGTGSRHVESWKKLNQVSPMVRSTVISNSCVQAVQSPVKIALRQFHANPPIRMLKGGRDPFNQNPFRNFRFFTSGGLLMLILPIATIIGMITLLFFVLPALFAFFFPLIILGIAFQQFRSYQSRKLAQLLHSALRQTKLKLSYPTRKELVLRAFAPKYKRMSELKGLGKGFPFQFSPQFQEAFSTMDFPNAERFLAFLQARVDESIAKNEHGIRSAVFGDNYTYHPDDVELSTDFYEVIEGSVNGESIQHFVFKLVAKGPEGVKKPVAFVSVVSTSDPTRDDFFDITSTSDSTNKMVIVVKALTPWLKCGFITDLGETGSDTKFSVRKRRDGSREYTYHQ